jgi:OPA family glycerol-3-phosphate transporter-like MFS transporter
LLNGPLVDKYGGRKGMLMASMGSSLANILMGVVTYLLVTGKWTMNLVLTYSVLYGMNMFFQSYGAVSIIKVKAYWFHVRERGIFGAIFGTLISVGIYFAFDWGQSVADAAKLVPGKALNPVQQLIRTVFAVDSGKQDAIWLVFFVPAGILLIWFVIDAWLLKDTPAQAGFEDFDTHDASSGEMDREFSIKDLLHRVFTHPVLLTVSLIEFTSGVIRNGILQWYFIFSKEVPQPGAEFFRDNWGLLLCLTGIFGGFLSGWLSDHVFHSRRGPPAAIMNGAMLLLTIVMSCILLLSPVGVGTCAVLISLAAIGVHSIMSGTAAADFGGRKATATASGITDGFVYLGSGLQSISLGFLTEKSWQFWPIFLVPFAMIGLVLALRIWKAIPDATKKYLQTVEKLDLNAEAEKPGIPVQTH